MLKSFLRICSILLVAVMLANALPLQVFAEEQQKATADVSVSDTVPKDVRIAEEKIHKRTEYSKEFHLNNGLSMAVVYPEAVHYQDGGQWKEIDNTLQLSTDGAYTNAAGLWDVRFPQQLNSSNGISITKDGYTLSFAMAGEIVNKGLFAKAGDSETLTVSGAQASTARVETVDNTEMKNAAEYPETVPDKLKSRLTYSGVYQNTNVIYDLDSNKVKESIVLSRYNSALSGYRYTLQVGSLIPVLEESGQILFFTPDKKDVVMVMPAPYLVDADNVYNTDVQVTLTGSGSTYTLTYTLPKTWLAAQDRAWPVVLDPMVTPTMNTSNIKDRTVAENVTYSAGSGILECGYSTQYGVERIYLQYAGLPALTGSQTVVSASIQMYKVLDSAVEIPVEVHKVNATWDSNTITWANKPGYNSIVEDYKLVKNEGFYAWEITNIVRGWYENGNTGMMFKAPNSAEQAGTNNWKQFCSSDYSDYHNLKPLLVITFRDNKGIEPYYTYQTLSAGHAGTAYISDSTGQLKVVKSIASYASTVNPFDLELVYNSDYFARNSFASDGIKNTHGIDMLFGTGFTLNIIQSVKAANLSNAVQEYLVWHDGDGTDHYFAKQSDGTYKDEDGLNLTITASGNDYTMKNDQGYTWFFDDGLLSQMYDETGNKIWIEWQGSGSSRWFRNIYQENKNGTRITVASVIYKSGTSLINSLTDAAGRVYTFTYTAAGQLIAIYMGQTQLVRYDYGDDNANNRLVGMKDMESGYQLWYTYQSGKVKTFQEWMNANTSGAIVEVTYGAEITTYRDYGADRTKNTADDILTNYIFDNWGRTVNAYSTDSTKKMIGASNAVYTGSGSTAENANVTNRVEKTATIGIAAQNLLTNHGFESGTSGWSLSWTGDKAKLQSSTYTRHTGSQSLEGWIGQGHTGGSISASTAATLAANTTYTLSAYVDTSWIESFAANGGIRLIAASSSDGTYHSQFLNYNTETISGKWTRISVTFTTNNGGYYTLMVQGLNITGWFYVDDVQLEQGEAPSNYNLLENGTLDNGSSGWLFQQGASVGNAYNNNLISVVGDPTKDACAWQNIKLNLPGTETYVLSGWAWADSVPDNEDVKTGDQYPQDTVKRFGLQARITYSDGTYEYHYTPFCPDIHTWQYASLTIVPKQPTKTVTTIQVVCAYEKNANTVWFDNISLVREAAQTMRYDDEGNLISVTTTGMDKETAEYENGNLLKAYTGGSGTYTYAYDTTYKHRVTAVDDGVVKQSYTYDSKGNVTSTTLKNLSNGSELATSATYTVDGNRIEIVTDANGSHVWYYYDTALSQMTGAATQVCTAPAGTTDETAAGIQWRYTRSVYDSFGRVTETSIANKATTDYNDGGMTLDPTVNYSYDSKGNLSTVERTAEDVTQHYILAYDVWGNRTAISVGELELACYTYAAQNGNLLSMTYGNGDTVSYTYDSLNRIKTQTNTAANGAVTRILTYTYTGDGQLYSVHDSATGQTQRAVYDGLGRVATAQQGDMVTSYEYDAYARLVRSDFTDGVLGDGTQTYTYDAANDNGYSDGILTSMGMVSGGTITYYYDGLQRLTNKDIAGEVWETFVYDNTRVSQKRNYIGNTQIQTFQYVYDSVGNITQESLAENGTTTTRIYTYDKLNQLIEVKENGVVKERYSYDNAGNIKSFNNGNDINREMTYTHSQWKDLLTAVGNQTITYDAIGNPINYYNGYTFTWAEGRRLQSATVGENQTYGYLYNADGLRIRKNNPNGTYIVYHIADGRYVGETHYSADHTPDLHIRYIYDENDSVVGISLRNEGSDTWEHYYFVKNLQGDILRVYKASDNSLAASYTYDAWGNILTSTGSLADLNPFRYRGYYYDAETEFYYLQSRYYDPAIGRFLNADGYVSTGQDFTGYNIFAYCGNNPVMRIDQTGNAWEWWKDFWNGVKAWVEEEKEEAQNNVNITTSFGVTASGAFGAGGSVSYGLTFDTKGNIGNITTANGGAGFPSLGVGGFLSINNTPTIYFQEGLGAVAGASGGPGVVAVGGEYNMIIDQGNGKAYHGGNLSVTYGFYPTIVEVHGEVGNTWVWGFNIYDKTIEVIDFFLGK